MQKTIKFLALRIDDIGASSKKYEVYSDVFRGIGNILFLKYLPPFKRWGPYREMTAGELDSLFIFLKKNRMKITAAVTATWVEKDGKMTPFPKKFPQQATILKEALKEGVCEIANHGLTHCYIGKHLPRLFTSNRKYHREFYPYLSGNIHREHLSLSQEILENYFQDKIITLVPPGNLLSESAKEFCANVGLKIISASCNEVNEYKDGIFFLSREDTIAFHDRDIVLSGLGFLQRILDENPGTVFLTVRDKVKKLMEKY